MADGWTADFVDPGTVQDAEARRWQDYAERWGTDQYDGGPWMWTGPECLALAYAVVSVVAKVWLALVELGLVD